MTVSWPVRIVGLLYLIALLVGAGGILRRLGWR